MIMARALKGEQVCFRLSGSERQRLRSIAGKLGISISEACRRVVAENTPHEEPEMEKAVIEMETRFGISRGKIFEILLMAFLTRQAAWTIAHGTDASHPIQEFRYSEDGRIMDGLRLGEILLSKYVADNRALMEVEKYEALLEQLPPDELIDNIGNRLSEVRSVLKRISDVLNLPVYLELPGAKDIRKAVQAQVLKLDSLPALQS